MAEKGMEKKKAIAVATVQGRSLLC